MYEYKLKDGSKIESNIFVPEQYVDMLEDLRQLASDGQNPNKMTDKQKDATWESLSMFGWVYPIVANSEGCFADGEQRVDVAVSRKQFYGPVLRLSIKDVDRRLLRQVLNKLKGTHDKLLDAQEFKRISTAERSEDLKKLLNISNGTLERYDKILNDSTDSAASVLDNIYEVIIKCKDEQEQQRTFEELKEKGYDIRILTL